MNESRRERVAGAMKARPVAGQTLLRSMLLLLGASIFAFLLAEAVHELGHFLAHRAVGRDVAIRLDPFGGRGS